MVSILSGEALCSLFNHLDATSRGRFLLLLITYATNSWFYCSSSLFLWCVMEGNFGGGICQAAWIGSMVMIGNCEDQSCIFFSPSCYDKKGKKIWCCATCRALVDCMV